MRPWPRQKTHDWEVVSSNPYCGDHLSWTIHLDQSKKAKFEWKLTWHCCICCYPAKGWVDFEHDWLIKSSVITKDEMRACQLTRTNLPQKNVCLINLDSYTPNFINRLTLQMLLKWPERYGSSCCWPMIFYYKHCCNSLFVCFGNYN